MTDSNPTMERLDDQLNWYDRKSISCQTVYKRLAIAELVAAAAIPFSAAIAAYAWLTGGLGVLVVVLKGVESLNRYQHNWITYRSTCEALKHEKYLWLAKAGPYADAARPEALLAERVESLISTEHAKWVVNRQQPRQEPASPAGEG